MKTFKDLLELRKDVDLAKMIQDEIIQLQKISKEVKAISKSYFSNETLKKNQKEIDMHVSKAVELLKQI